MFSLNMQSSGICFGTARHALATERIKFNKCGSRACKFESRLRKALKIGRLRVEEETIPSGKSQYPSSNRFRVRFSMVSALKNWNCEYIDLFDGCPWGEATTIDLSLISLDT
jgi:hypothetical protein